MFLLDDVEVRSLPGKGRGVFTLTDIPAGALIGDYLGLVIQNDEIDEKKQGLYSMTLNEKLAILGDPKEEGIHLINQSCEPNCAMYPLGEHTVYFARRKIFSGEELTVSYLIGPPDADCNPCTHQCECGALSCRGSLHCSETELSTFLAFERTELRKQDAFADNLLYEVGQNLQPLASYPKEIVDHPIYPIFAATDRPSLEFSREVTLDAIRHSIRASGRRCHISAIGADVYAVIGSEIRARYA